MFDVCVCFVLFSSISWEINECSSCDCDGRKDIISLSWFCLIHAISRGCSLVERDYNKFIGWG